MDGKYDKVVGGSTHHQGAPKRVSVREALRLMRVIVRKGGGIHGKPKQGPEVTPATASLRRHAKTQPKVGRQRHTAKGPAKAKTLVAKVLVKKKPSAADAKARVRVTRGGGAPKTKRSFELGRPGPDPQTRQASKLFSPARRTASQPDVKTKPTA